MSGARLQATAGKLVIFVVQCAIGLSFLYPLYFMMINALKNRPGYYTNPFALPKPPFQWTNFSAMVSQFKILLLFRNTFIICLATLALLVVVYIFYVQSRQRYFSERNLRALSVLSEQLEGAIEDLKSAVRNAADQAVKSDPQDPGASFGRIIALTPNLHPAGPRDGLPCSVARPKLGAVGVCIAPYLVRSRQSSVETRPGAGNPSIQ